jgi:hypothetical protein
VALCRTKRDGVVGPIDERIMTTQPSFPQDHRDRAKLGDLKNDVLQVLIDQELESNLMCEV